MNDKEIIKQLVDALERMKGYGNIFLYGKYETNPYEQMCEAIEVGREALAQPEQEPVYLVWMYANGAWLETDKEAFDKAPEDERRILYTAPQPQPLTVPQGWKLVPVEPTTEMAAAYWKYNDRTDVVMRHAYRAMLAAAPQAPAVQPLDGWNPIETAPKDGTDILVMYVHIETQIVHNGFYIYDADDQKETGWWSYDHSECSRIKLDDWMTPTHWMPLPTPPAAHGITPEAGK